MNERRRRQKRVRMDFIDLNSLVKNSFYIFFFFRDRGFGSCRRSTDHHDGEEPKGRHSAAVAGRGFQLRLETKSGWGRKRLDAEDDSETRNRIKWGLDGLHSQSETSPANA